MSTSATKRRKLGPDQEYEEITAAEYEEDLDSILIRIKEQDDSEALALQLEAEWNSTANVPRVGNSNEMDVIVIPDDDEENDEEMARRLAQEWDEQDSRNVNVPSQPISSSSSRSDSPLPVKRRPSSSSFKLSPPGPDTPPDEKLLEYQDLFTQERSCPKCNKTVESPRGQVCVLCICQLHRLT
jgi:baculoviral IAP repeat-containing protein 6